MKKKIISIFGIILIITILTFAFIKKSSYASESEEIIIKNYIADTIYETDDTPLVNATISEKYRTGEIDASDVIQNALYYCYSKSGGTVYLPSGRYLIKKAINIPTSCVLRGDYQDPDLLTDNVKPDYGTIIIVDMPESEQNKTNGVFAINGSSGVIGLTIYYKDQTLTNINNKLWTFYYTDSILFTIKNVTMINAYKGIGKELNNPANQVHEMLMLENVKGTVINSGVLIHNSADVGTIEGLYLKPDYWVNANMKALTGNDYAEHPNLNSLMDYYQNSSNETKGLILTDAEQSQMSDITIKGFKYGIYIPDLKSRFKGSGSFYNLNIIDSVNGIYNASSTLLDGRWGYAISYSSIECYCKSCSSNIEEQRTKCYAIYNNAAEENISGTKVNDDLTPSNITSQIGTFKLYDVNLKGKTYGSVIYNSPSLKVETYSRLSENETHTLTRTSNLPIEIKDTKTIQKTYGKALKEIKNGQTANDINNAIKEVSKNGGGVVFINPGMYTINETINILANVELRGVSSVSMRNLGWTPDENSPEGTIFLISDDFSQSIIKLNGDNSGISGIYIIAPKTVKLFNEATECGEYDGNLLCKYSNKNPIDIKEEVYKQTVIYSENNNHVYVKNVLIIGTQNNIEFKNCDNFVIANLLTASLTLNIKINGGSNGIIKNCLQNGTVMSRNNLYGYDEANKLINFQNIATKIFTNIEANGTKNLKIKNCFTCATKNFFRIQNHSTIYATNIGSDNIAPTWRKKTTNLLVWDDGTNNSGLILNVLRFNGAFSNFPTNSSINFANISYLNEEFTNPETNDQVYVVGGIQQKNQISNSHAFISTTKDIENAITTNIKDQEYTGANITPNIQLSLDKTNLTPNTDYKLNYYNNIEKGIATIIVYGINDYKGMKELHFNINDKEINISDILEQELINTEINSEKQTLKVKIKDSLKETLKIADILPKINQNANTEIYDKNDKLLDQNTTIYTGMLIKFKYHETSDNFTIIVSGDTSGDGLIDVNDVAKIYQYCKNTEKPPITEEYYLSAGNVAGDDNLVLINDIVKLFQFVQGKITTLD